MRGRSIIEPLWDQFAALIPPVIETHPLGCHRPRIVDRIIFDKLIQILVLGASYAKISDSTCSATILRTRRDEWIDAGIFQELEQLCLEFYDRIVGLDLENVGVDGCIVKAACGGEVAGRSPVDRGKQGTKRSLMVDGACIPIECVVAGANRHDSPLLRPTLDKLGRFGFDLPDEITLHLDAGYDLKKTCELLTELGCGWETSTKDEPLQAGARWVVKRTNSWHNRSFVCDQLFVGRLSSRIRLSQRLVSCQKSTENQPPPHTRWPAFTACSSIDVKPDGHGHRHH